MWILWIKVDNYVDNTLEVYPARLPDQTRRYRAKRSPPGFLLGVCVCVSYKEKIRV